MTDWSAQELEDLEPSSRGTLLGHGETDLAYVRWEHPSPRGRVVLSHGYGEHSERYRHVAAWLFGLGFSVSAMDHKGFGRSGGRRGDARGIRPFVGDLALFLRQERRHDHAGLPPRLEAGSALPRPTPPPFPQILLGHSFGGLLALLTLLWHPDTMDALFVTSPAVTLRPTGPVLKVAQGLLRCLAPHWSLDLPNDKDQVCSDPLLVKRYWEDPLCHRRISAAFAAAMAEGRRELLPMGAELERPILLLEAGEDHVVDPDGSEELWRAVRPSLLERHRLVAFKHEILHDLRRREAQQLAEAWLDRLPGIKVRNPQAPELTTMNVT